MYIDYLFTARLVAYRFLGYVLVLLLRCTLIYVRYSGTVLLTRFARINLINSLFRCFVPYTGYTYVSYNRYHSVFRKVLFVAVLFWSRLVHADLAMHATLAALCSGRDSCMLTSRCILPWLRSAPYPALCPCEPLGPVGDMQAVSYGARSRQYSPLLPASSS